MMIIDKIFAANPPSVAQPPVIPNVIPNITIDKLADNILVTIYVILGLVALFAIVYNGIQLITAAGDPEKVAKAKRGLIWAIVGIIIVAGLYRFVSIAGLFIKSL